MRLAVVLVLLVAGCRGGGGELRDWVWRDREAAFRIGPLPPAWQLLEGEGDVAFHEPASGAVILANADCRERLDAPLTVLRNSLLIGFTDRRVVVEREVEVAGRAALRSELSARLDGVPVELITYVLKKDGCVYDLVYAAPPELFAERARDFERLVAGFATLGRGA